MQFSAFAPFGMFRFTSDDSPAEVIYDSLTKNQGDAFADNWDGEQSIINYATAMCLAAAQSQQFRAANADNPEYATETLPDIERDYLIVPRYRASDAERRADLLAAKALHHGARRDSMEDGLRTIMGDEFVAVYVRDVPTRSGADLPGTFPGTIDPDQGQGHFVPDSYPIQVIELLESVPTLGVPLLMPFEIVFGSTAEPKIGSTYCVDVGFTGKTEEVTIDGISGTHLIITFQNSHESGARMTSAPVPYQTSIRKHWAIAVTASALADGVLMKRAHAFVEKAIGGTAIWDFVLDNGDGTSGPFEIDSGIIGQTPIEEITY